MKKILFLLTGALLFNAVSVLAQAPKVSHIWPNAGINEESITAHIYGDSLIAPISSVKLTKSGYPDIDGISINVVSQKYLTCSFDLSGISTGLYDLSVTNASGSDTLPGCFTIYSACDSPYVWVKTIVGSCGDYADAVAVGDGNNDGETEVYGAGWPDNTIYQFKWDGTSWVETVVGSAGDWISELAVGDGNDDGEMEVYGVIGEDNLYQFKWDGTSWVETTVGSGWSMRGVVVGDGNGDGEIEVYSGGFHLYEFKWDGASWERTTVDSGGAIGVAIGDGNGDGRMGVYGAGWGSDIYQFEWDAGWVKTTVDSGGVLMWGVAVGDGNGDGESEVYGASADSAMYEFKWDGAGWVKTTTGSGRAEMYRVAAGDGNGDGKMEVYGACWDGGVYQFEWDGSGWVKTTVGLLLGQVNGVAVGDGNGDGKMEVYGVDYTGIYQFKPVRIPDTPRVTYVWPDAGINQQSITARIYGNSFQVVPVSSVKLIRSGYPDIDGTSINVVSQKYLTCSFDLTGDLTGLYDLVAANDSGSDTLPGCFTIYLASPSPCVWTRTTVGSGAGRMTRVVVGDGNDDGEIEVYSVSGDTNLYQFKWDGTSWVKTTLGRGVYYMYDVAVGDGNDDGEIEVYGASDDSISQFKWDGMSWVKTSVGRGWDGMYGLTVGDGCADGETEVYDAFSDHIFQFKWDGASWMQTYVGSGEDYMYGVLVGDGDGDGEIEVYGGNADGSIYQFKWDGMTWQRVTVGSGGQRMLGVTVGDGNGDGEIEIYGANRDSSIYQFKWDGVTWQQVTVGSGGQWTLGVTVGDGNGDGEIEIYGANRDSSIYQFKWDGVSWLRTTVGSGLGEMSGVAVGDGNGDGEMEVYGACFDGSVYQFKPAFVPDMVLSDTMHDFGLVLIGDSLDWEYLVIRNAGVDTLFVDSVMSDVADFMVAVPSFPQTILPQDSTLVTLRFKPSIEGAIAGTLWVYSNDPDESTLYVALTGEGAGVGMEEARTVPGRFSFALKSNPVRGKVIFSLTVPDPGEITLRIYDIAGRLVDRPIEGRKLPGIYEIPCRSDMNSGVYFYRLETPWGKKTGKLVLIQ